MYGLPLVKRRGAVFLTSFAIESGFALPISLQRPWAEQDKLARVVPLDGM